MAFPTTNIVDTFNREDGTITSTGNGTTSYVFDVSGFGAGAQTSVASNQAKAASGNASTDGTWKVGPYPPNQEAYVTVATALTTGYDEYWLYNRVTDFTTDADSYYADWIRESGVGTSLVFLHYDGTTNTGTILGSTATTGVGFSSGGTIGLTTTGTANILLEAYVNGTVVHSYTDTSNRNPGSGHIGFGLYEATTNNVRLDNFGGGAQGTVYPYISGVQTTYGAIASGTVGTASLPGHATNDILFFMASKNGSANLTCSTSGWATVDSALNTNHSHALFWKRAASASETNPVVTSSTSASSTDGLYWTSFAVRGAITTGTPYEGFATNTVTSSTTPQVPNVVTSSTATLVLNLSYLDDDNTVSSGFPRTGHAVVLNQSSTTGGDTRMLVSQTQKHLPGTVTGGTAATMSANDYWKGIGLAIIPEPTSGPQTITGTALASAEAFGTPTILPGAVSRTPDSINSAESVGTPTLTSLSTISLTGYEINSAQSVGTPTLTPGPVSISLTGYEVASAESVGTPTVTPGAVLISLTGYEIASAEALGTPTVTQTSPAQTITLTGYEIASAESVSNPTITTGPVTVSLNSVNSAEAFENPTVIPGSRTITLTGYEIGSAESVSQPTITRGAVTISLTGHEIASAESVGTPTITVGAVTISANSVNSAEAFENPSITTGPVTVSLNSVDSGESVTNPTVVLGSPATQTITALSFGDLYGPEVLTDDPVFYHRFEKGYNGTADTYLDHSGNGYTAPVTGVAGTAQVRSGTSPIYNQGPSVSIWARGDVTSSVITTSGTPNNAPSTAVTVETWIKTNGKGNWPNWVNRGWVGDGYLMFADNTNAFIWGIAKSGAQYNVNSTGISSDNGTWYHLVGVYDPADGKTRLYINGTENVAYSGSVSITSFSQGDYRYASFPSLGTAYYREFAETAVYNTALSASRIAEHYEAALGIGRGTVTTVAYISPNDISSAESVGTPTITLGVATITLTGYEIASAESVSEPTITVGAVTIAPNSISSGEAFDNSTISVGPVTVSLESVTSAEAFDNPTILRGAVTVSPNEIASTEAFDNPTITVGPVTVSLESVNSAESVGTPTLSTLATISPDSVNSAESVGTPTLSASATIVGSSVEPSEAFGEPTLTPGPVTINLNSVDSAEAFSNPTVILTGGATQTINLDNQEIGSAEAFENPTVSAGPVTVALESISSAEAFDNPSISTANTIALDGIPSGEAFDSPTVSSLNNVEVYSVDSAELVGQPTLTYTFTINPDSLVSAESFSDPVVSQGFLIVTQSISSSEAFDNPTLSPGPVYIVPEGVATEEAFGLGTVSAGVVVITPNGVLSGEAFGSAVISGQYTLYPLPVDPTGSVGTPTVYVGLPSNVAEVMGSTSALTNAVSRTINNDKPQTTIAAIASVAGNTQSDVKVIGQTEERH